MLVGARPQEFSEIKDIQVCVCVCVCVCVRVCWCVCVCPAPRVWEEVCAVGVIRLIACAHAGMHKCAWMLARGNAFVRLGRVVTWACHSITS